MLPFDSSATFRLGSSEMQLTLFSHDLPSASLLLFSTIVLYVRTEPVLYIPIARAFLLPDTLTQRTCRQEKGVQDRRLKDRFKELGRETKAWDGLVSVVFDHLHSCGMGLGDTGLPRSCGSEYGDVLHGSGGHCRWMHGYLNMDRGGDKQSLQNV